MLVKLGFGKTSAKQESQYQRLLVTVGEDVRHNRNFCNHQFVWREDHKFP